MVVKREAIRNSTSGTYASLMCVFALSSVVGMNITSVYPGKLEQVAKYSQFQNGTVLPRLVHDNFKNKLVQEVKLILMWTTDGTHTLPGMSENFQPNHFVPLVEFIAKNMPKKTIQPKITDLFRFESLQNDQSTSEGKLIMQLFHIQCNYVI